MCMDFAILYKSTDCTTDAETVGLAVYFLCEHKDYESVRKEDILDLLLNSNVRLQRFPEPNSYRDPKARDLVTPIKQADRRGWIRKNLQGDCFLDEEGKEYFEERIKEPMPDESAPQGRFIDISVEDEFYQDIVEETNLCYRVGSYNGVLVLYRKFLENILIDILREKYGMENKETFYNEEEKRFRSFSLLIEEFESHLDDFRHHSSLLQCGGADEIIAKIKEYRKRANPSAHSIDHSISKQEIRELQPEASDLANDLLQLKQRIDQE